MVPLQATAESEASGLSGWRKPRPSRVPLHAPHPSRREGGRHGRPPADRISLLVLRAGSELAGVPLQRDGIDLPGEVVVSVLSDDVPVVVDLHGDRAHSESFVVGAIVLCVIEDCLDPIRHASENSTGRRRSEAWRRNLAR